MKQYIFILEKPIGPSEIIIEAKGMLDAFKEAKKIQIKAMKENASKIDIQFRGVIYPH